MNLTVAMGLKAIVVSEDVIDVVKGDVTADAADPVALEASASPSGVIFNASNCSNQCRLGLKP